MSWLAHRGQKQGYCGRLLLSCALAALLAGCNAGRVFVASPGDYADYRRVRLAEGFDARMATAWEYLQRRPDGRYHQRLRRYFDKSEPVYYQVRMRNIAGLKAYLRALPNGPHAKEALQLLGVRNYEKRRQSLDDSAVRTTQLRLSARKTNRKSAAALLNWWLLALSESSVWREPWSRLPQAAIIRYRMSSPAPVCEMQEEGQQCHKPMRRHFVVTGEDGPAKRTLALDMRVNLDERYHPRSVVFSGRNMLMRQHEARSARALDENDDEGRRTIAADFSRDLVAALLEAELLCNGASDASGVTVLDCEHLRITIQPSFDGGDDIVVLSRPPQQAPNGPIQPAAPPAADGPEPIQPAARQPAPAGNDDLYE